MILAYEFIIFVFMIMKSCCSISQNSCQESLNYVITVNSYVTFLLMWIQNMVKYVNSEEYQVSRGDIHWPFLHVLEYFTV